VKREDVKREDVKRAVFSSLIEHCVIDEIHESSLLKEDLDMDSLDLVQVEVLVECEIDCDLTTIKWKTYPKTVGDLINGILEHAEK
jgi:acyl carrier protein